MEPSRSDSEDSEGSEGSLGTLGSPLSPSSLVSQFRSESQGLLSPSGRADSQVSQVSQVSPDSELVIQMKNAIDGMELNTPNLQLQKTEEKDLKCYTTFDGTKMESFAMHDKTRGAAAISRNHIAFHPQLPMLVMGSNGGYVSCWDVTKPKNHKSTLNMVSNVIIPSFLLIQPVVVW